MRVLKNTIWNHYNKKPPEEYHDPFVNTTRRNPSADLHNRLSLTSHHVLHKSLILRCRPTSDRTRTLTLPARKLRNLVPRRWPPTNPTVDWYSLSALSDTFLCVSGLHWGPAFWICGGVHLAVCAGQRRIWGPLPAGDIYRPAMHRPTTGSDRPTGGGSVCFPRGHWKGADVMNVITCFRV